VVTVAHRPGRKRGEVGTRARLTEQLAPFLFVAHDRWEEPQSLVLGPVAEQGCGSIVEPQRVQSGEPQRAQHPVDGPRDLIADAKTAVLGCPGRYHETRCSIGGVPLPVIVLAANGPQRIRALGGRCSPLRGHLGLDPPLYLGDRVVGGGGLSDG
jgi:hypothetical protein